MENRKDRVEANYLALTRLYLRRVEPATLNIGFTNDQRKLYFH